jgi:replicative DNA helicase
MSTTVTGMLPSTPEIERAVLSSLLNQDGTDRILREIKPESFNVPANRLIFETIAATPGADMVTVTQRLTDAGKVDEIGGAGAINDIARIREHYGEAWNYAAVLRSKFLAREAVLAGMIVSNAAMADDDPIETATRELSRLVELSRDGKRRDRSMREIMVDFIDDLERRMQSDTASGFESRFPSLNEAIGGIPRNYIVIGGETSSGKSSLAQSLLEDVAFTHGKRALWYSLEMGERDLAYRLAASRGSIDGKRIFNPRNHPLRRQDTQALTRAVSELAGSDIVLRPETNIIAEQIRAEARDFAADGNLGIIVVDYLQLEDAAAKSDRNATQEKSFTAYRRRSWGRAKSWMYLSSR